MFLVHLMRLKGVLLKVLGWKETDFPSWFNWKKARIQFGCDFSFKGIHMRYHALYNGKESMGSSDCRFYTAYDVYEKFRSKK